MARAVYSSKERREVSRSSFKIYVPHQKWKKHGSWKSIVAKPDEPDVCVARLLREYLTRVNLSTESKDSRKMFVFRAVREDKIRLSSPISPLSAQECQSRNEASVPAPWDLWGGWSPGAGTFPAQKGGRHSAAEGPVDQADHGARRLEAAVSARLFLSGPLVVSAGGFRRLVVARRRRVRARVGLGGWRRCKVGIAVGQWRRARGRGAGREFAFRLVHLRSSVREEKRTNVSLGAQASHVYVDVVVAMVYRTCAVCVTRD